jgi:myosin heavy subunit
MVAIGGVDEKEDFEETCRSLAALGFPRDDVDYIFMVCV